MFRGSLFVRSVGTRTSIKRWMTAATSRQKRALNEQQLQGASSTASPSPAPSDTSPPLPSSGGGNWLPLAVVGVVTVGGAAYYFNTMGAESSIVEDKPMQEKGQEKHAPESVLSGESIAMEKPALVEEDIAVSGNRVVSIQVPHKMKNTAALTVVPAPHPEKGNRVSMDVKKSKPIDDSSMTEKAISELQDTQTEQAAEALLESHQSVWSTMDSAYFQDLDSLTMAQLKARVVQLATEMKDRTKWEAVRLKEFLAMKEKETADKYMEIMQKQRLEFEDLMATRLREKEDEFSNRMRKVLQDKDATVQSVINSALDAQKAEHESDMKSFEDVTVAEIQSKLQDEYEGKLVEFKETVAQDMQQKVAALSALTDKLSQLEAALEASRSSKEGSLRAHRLSAAALALAEKLETSQGAETELKALRVASGPDGVIATALATIPDSVKNGVPTLSELQARFEAVHKKGRQAALVPAGRQGLEGQLAGMMFATLKYPPRPDDPAPEADKDNAEYVLVRAQNYVQLGELERAVEQLEKLEGQSAFTVADWKKDALNRVAVEKALKVIKMECALLNESLVV